MTKQLITLLGFDFGTHSIGVAVGQMVTKTATPLTSLKAKQGVPNWDEVAKIIKTWQPDAAIVGEPLDREGKEFAIAKLAKKFAEELERRFNLTVYQINEHLTTIEARAQLFNQRGFKSLTKAAVDAKSAQLILESWMNNYEL